jgi:hypothetical protein
MKMETVILQLLILLYIKHWYIDFVNQNDAEIASKGIYGDKLGILHSAKHGILTALCVFFVTGYMYLIYAIILGVIDFVAHYHIDWVKSNYGNNNIKTKEFWNHLGLDQLAHQLVYLFIAFMIS